MGLHLAGDLLDVVNEILGPRWWVVGYVAARELQLHCSFPPSYCFVKIG